MWTRIASAAVLAPLFLVALFKLPETGLLAMLGLLLLGVAWEAMTLAGIGVAWTKLVILAGMALAAAGGWYATPTQPAQNDWVFLVSGLATAWWCVHVFLLSRFSVDRPGTYGSVFGRSANVVFILLTTWIAITALTLHDSHQPLLLVYVLVMVWIADSGAYFAGRFLGRHKLAPRVSPGKTIEGVVGGLAAVGVYSYIYGTQVFGIAGLDISYWVGLALLVSAVSVAGDLNESAIKRVVGKKDSGAIIPGHGGLFDRVDAMTAALPVFYFGWRLLGWGGVQ